MMSLHRALRKAASLPVLEVVRSEGSFLSAVSSCYVLGQSISILKVYTRHLGILLKHSCGLQIWVEPGTPQLYEAPRRCPGCLFTDHTLRRENVGRRASYSSGLTGENATYRHERSRPDCLVPWFWGEAWESSFQTSLKAAVLMSTESHRFPGSQRTLGSHPSWL